MALVNAHQVRLFASHVTAVSRERRAARPQRQQLAAVDLRDVPLSEPRNALEELVHALGSLIPPERG
jgi:hypothetical protein